MLEFTGERFTPEQVREIWYEHWHRYAFVAELARGKRVLDAACGEGYGSALLAQSAAEVVGIDIASDAIAHAGQRYGRENLRFIQGDCTALPPDLGVFDLAVSFETLEHVAAQEALIAGLARVLAPDGLLVVSSPDKRNYSDRTGFHNEYHVRELYREELLELLGRHFTHVRLFAQKLLFQSAIWALEPSAGGGAQAVTVVDGVTESGLRYEPMYYVAVCSRSAPSAAPPSLSLFGDADESVYRHYNGEIRKNMTAGTRIAELEAQLAALEGAAPSAPASASPANAAPQAWWRRWSRRRS